MPAAASDTCATFRSSLPTGGGRDGPVVWHCSTTDYCIPYGLLLPMHAWSGGINTNGLLVLGASRTAAKAKRSRRGGGARSLRDIRHAVCRRRRYARGPLHWTDRWSRSTTRRNVQFASSSRCPSGSRPLSLSCTSSTRVYLPYLNFATRQPVM